MNEKTKSVWSRLWKGWRGVAGWFVILSTAVLFTLILLRLAEERPSTPTGEIVLQSLITALAGAVVVTLIVGFVRWICCWRNVRRFLFGVACFATLIALFYAEENIRGKLAWNAYVHEVEARGESLDLTDFIPPPVPDDQNFTLCPLLKPVFDFTYGKHRDATHPHGDLEWHDTNGLAKLERISVYAAVDNYVNSLPSGELHEHLALQAKTIRTDLPLLKGWVNLVGFQDFMLLGTNLNGVALTASPATNVLLGLRPFDADLAELEACASERPLDRWSIAYDTNNPYAILVPNLQRLMPFCRLLQLPASAKLAIRNTDGALEDMALAFRFAESVRDEPFIISQLVRIASHKLNVQPLKEGLARHQFTPSQLTELQDQYGSADILAGATLSLRGGRAGSTAMVRAARRNPAMLALIVNGFQQEGSDMPGLDLLAKCAPSGWYHQNARTLCRLYDLQALPAIDEIERRVWPKTADSLETAIDNTPPVYGALAKFLFMPARKIGAFGGVFVECAAGQTLVDQTVIACALERYHIANGRYPEKLEALFPDYLEDIPHDIITGEPMIYRTLPDGRYILYSVGWDGNDDGGAPSIPDYSVYPDPENPSDWIWELPDPKLQPY